MKLSQIVKGNLAREPVEFTLITGEIVSASFRPLLGGDETIVMSKAQTYATANGTPAELAKPGNPIYDYGQEIWTILLSVVDKDEPEKVAPFFDGGEDQLLKNLDRDRIAMLYEMWQVFQDSISPRDRKMGQNEYISKILDLVRTEDRDQSPFDSMRLTLLRSFTRTMARQLWGLLTAKSPSGSFAEVSISGSTTEKHDEPEVPVS